MVSNDCSRSSEYAENVDKGDIGKNPVELVTGVEDPEWAGRKNPIPSAGSFNDLGNMTYDDVSFVCEIYVEFLPAV